MKSRIGAGIVAGLVAGIVWGVLLMTMQTPMPTGDQVSMMTQIARAVRSESLAVAWGAHLLTSVVLGLLFAVLAGRRGGAGEAAAAVGLGYGLAVWVVGWQVAMPLLLGETVFGFLRDVRTVPFAIGSLLGHVVYGALLGGGVAWLSRRWDRQAARSPGMRRAV